MRRVKRGKKRKKKAVQATMDPLIIIPQRIGRTYYCIRNLLIIIIYIYQSAVVVVVAAYQTVRKVCLSHGVMAWLPDDGGGVG